MKNILIIMMSLLLLNACKKEDDIKPNIPKPNYKHQFLVMTGGDGYDEQLIISKNGRVDTGYIYNSYHQYFIDSCNSGDLYTYTVKSNVTIPDMITSIYLDTNLIMYHCYGCKENTITYLVP